eukprot:1158637-Pelagomonas_calceolata.AAC.4
MQGAPFIASPRHSAFLMNHTPIKSTFLTSQLLELESVFCPCFYGAAVPPLVFAFFVSEQLELKAQEINGRAASSSVSSSWNCQQKSNEVGDATVNNGQDRGIGGTSGAADLSVGANSLGAPLSSYAKEQSVQEEEEEEKEEAEAAEEDQGDHEGGELDEPGRRMNVSEVNGIGMNVLEEATPRMNSSITSQAVSTQPRRATIPDPGIVMDDDEGSPAEDDTSPLNRQPLDLVQILVGVCSKPEHRR